jgi:hypothetical protein
MGELPEEPGGVVPCAMARELKVNIREKTKLKVIVMVGKVDFKLCLMITPYTLFIKEIEGLKNQKWETTKYFG